MTDIDLRRICAVAGIVGALITFAFGILHPKGTTDVGSLDEWMTRVGGSGVWVLVHFMLLVSSILVLIALVGIARSYTDGPAAAWARIGVVVATVATTLAAMTFLIDGAVVKDTADRWVAGPRDDAISGAARLATDIGFILVAGLQLAIGFVALLFALAGFSSKSHPAWTAWLALLTAAVGLVPGAVHYLAGPSTWVANASYVSNGLFATWVLVMSRRLWAPMDLLNRSSPSRMKSRPNSNSSV